MPERHPPKAPDFPDEVARLIGIDPTTDDRTKLLALRGRIAELDEQISFWAEYLRPKRGAPRKEASIDVRRALRLVALAKTLNENGQKPQTLTSLLATAIDAEKKFSEYESTHVQLFPDNVGRRVEISVRAGLKELGLDMGLYRRNPAGFFDRCKAILGQA